MASKTVLSLVLVCMTMHYITHVEASAECKFSSSVPKEIKKTVGHSKNNQALVVAAGYLRYYNHKEESQNFRYMPLEFESFEFNPNDMVGDYYMLKLNADCAEIFVELVKDFDDWKVDSVDVILNVGNNGAFICNLNDVNMTQVKGKHYGCDLANSPFVCEALIGLEQRVVKVADVVFTRLEFEVFGSTEKIKLNQFTTNTTTC